MMRHKSHLVNTLLPTLEAATPGSGAYLNEMDPLYKGDWKKEFYGANYDRLLKIKKKYDPDQLLYGLTSVGERPDHCRRRGTTLLQGLLGWAGDYCEEQLESY
ncbi:hypothetical protein PG997_002233 [Apiospora hydei]|uniref:Berberine/berberine-like domain-containing protein n=1 Tax=Apiospora hydei TaxID=1337664 RepID=A0ABR1X8U4_9PEZI